MIDTLKMVPRRMTPVANILVNVVPKRLARIPPTSGVQVLFKPKADNSKPNSVLEVPISRCSLLLRGPSIFEALKNLSIRK